MKFTEDNMQQPEQFFPDIDKGRMFQRKVVSVSGQSPTWKTRESYDSVWEVDLDCGHAIVAIARKYEVGESMYCAECLNKFLKDWNDRQDQSEKEKKLSQNLSKIGLLEYCQKYAKHIFVRSQDPVTKKWDSVPLAQASFKEAMDYLDVWLAKNQLPHRAIDRDE